MTRTLLSILVAAAIGVAAAPDAEAKNKVLRRSSYKATVKKKDKAVAKPTRAASAWAGDRCMQEARERRAKAARPKPAPVARVEAPPPSPVPPAERAWRISAGAAAGGNAVGMRVERGEGGGGLGTALSAAYGVTALASVRLSGKLRAGVGIDALLTGPLGEGMQYRTTEEVAGVVPFQHHQVDGRGELAYSGAIELAARAGYHYAHLVIDGESIDMPIVGESIGGYTVGMAAALPMDRVVLSASLDVMPAGVQAPTTITDGMLYGTAASAAWASAGLTYRMSARWLGTAAYRYGRSTIALSDGATDPSTATRIDQSHTVLAGIGLSL